MSFCLSQMLLRGDEIHIAQGRLCIIPTSGKPVPDEWLKSHSKELIREILLAMGQDAYEYLDYSTGFYGKHKAAGVTLQFASLVDGEGGFACLNVERKYSKGPNKGKLLPGKQFRIGERHALCKLWKSAGLKHPKRWAALHDYMGNLKQLVYVGVFKHGEKFANDSLQPLSVSREQVKAALLPYTIRTTDVPHSDIARTKVPDNDSAQDQAHKGLEPYQSAGDTNHGYKVVRVTGTRESLSHANNLMSPQDQTVEDWLADLGEVAVEMDATRS